MLSSKVTVLAQRFPFKISYAMLKLAIPRTSNDKPTTVESCANLRVWKSTVLMVLMDLEKEE